MIKGIFFDLDNTLIDTYNACKTAFSKCVERDLGKHKVDEVIEDMIKFQKSHPYLQKNKTEIGLAYYKEKYNVVINKSDSEYIKEFRMDATRNVKVFPNTIEVLEYLKDKYEIEIITNGTSQRQHEKMNICKIDKYFANPIISDEVNLYKPNKEIFLLACNQHNLKPSECVYVGDKPEFDIKGAHNAKMKAIYINNNQIHCPYEHILIKDLIELKGMF